MGQPKIQNQLQRVPKRGGRVYSDPNAISALSSMTTP